MRLHTIGRGCSVQERLVIDCTVTDREGRGYERQSALHFAASFDTLMVLLDRGADLIMADCGSVLPLMCKHALAHLIQAPLCDSLSTSKITTAKELFVTPLGTH